jgi:VanZ family protein
VAWAGLIFYLSTGDFGGGFSGALLRWFLQAVHLAVAPRTFIALNFLFRKLAHLTEYAVLAMLIYGSGRDEDPFRWQRQRAILSVLASGLYSLTDEFHQRYVPGRGPALSDCAIDTLGAILGTLIFYLRAAWVQVGKRESAARGGETKLDD